MENKKEGKGVNPSTATKGRKIHGLALIQRKYSTLNGMAWETSAVEIQFDSVTYVWISGLIDSLELQEGEIVKIDAFVRHSNNHLYKVKITSAPSVETPASLTDIGSNSQEAAVPHSETQCALCTRPPLLNSRYCSKHDSAPFARAILSNK